MLIQFFTDLIGDVGRYEWIYYIFACGFAIYIGDNIVKFLFAVISNLFKRGR